jgi:endo-1,4-beta-xylanase
MKRYNKLFASILAGLALASCSDDKLVFDVKKPGSLEEYEYLKNYDVLKTYANTLSPNFKLGAAVTVSEFNKRATEYSLITSNFNEVVAGYEMKHGAVVQADGTLNLTNVTAFISTAKDAGLDVYGHTLTWHANQNAAYLNKLIAPTEVAGSGTPQWEEISVATFETEEPTKYEGNAGAELSYVTGADGTGKALKVTNAVVRDPVWDSQIFFSFPGPAKAGDKYKLKMKIRADNTASAETQAHTSPGAYIHYAFFGTVPFTTEWKDYEYEVTIAEQVGANTIAFNIGAVATSYYFDDVTIEWLNPDAVTPTWDDFRVIDFDTDGQPGYEFSAGASHSLVPGKDGVGSALKIDNPVMKDEDWETQLFVVFPSKVSVGEQYTLSMDIKADIESAQYSTQAHTAPGAYKHWDFFGQLTATSQWTTFTKTITISASEADCNTIAFNLGKNVTSYYFDNIKITKYNEGGKQLIEKTPEEKYEIIYGELERWIAGIMEATKDHVKAWDVVNEPMDDANPSELKTGNGKELTADEFYWQDYLGEDYAVEAFKLAQQYGNSGDKLFINDYNLEYNLDKCRGLISYAEYIESKGGRVDGIGTQMHIHTGSDKGKITQMLELLAETGKLIKISELDIGIEGGIKTQNATSEQLRSQADMYKFVIEEYLRVIPASQQYGITIWSPKDSPSSSSWRAGEPIGLWTEGYDRKFSFGAVADALK